MYTGLLISLCLLASIQICAAVSQKPILVIGESDDVRSSHSRFINSIQSLGRTVDFKPANSDDIALSSDGQFNYDALVLLCPTSTSLKNKLPLRSILKFVDAGHNLFVTASTKFSSYTTEIAESIGVDLDTQGNYMIDYQNTVTDIDIPGENFIRAGGLHASKFLFGEAARAPDAPILFSGPGATLFADNELVDSVVWGAGSSFSHDVSKNLDKIPRVSGTASVLAAALSTRVGSRAAYFGSFHALSDRVFEKGGALHEEAMTSFLAWTLGYAGVLRTSHMRYSSVDASGLVLDQFRVKDEISFSIDIHSWDGRTDRWIPYRADDIQLEFVMLNPWVRTRLLDTANSNGTYTATIPIPDQIGVYKFSLQYFRPGVSPIMLSEVVPVRPYLHNEYERFIPTAAPYYASAFSMLVGVLLMGLVLLYGGQRDQNHAGKQD